MILEARQLAQAGVLLQVHWPDELVRVLAFANLAETWKAAQMLVHLLTEDEEVDVEQPLLHGLAVCQHGVGKEADAQDEEQVEQEKEDHFDDEAYPVDEAHQSLETAQVQVRVRLLQVTFMLVAISHDLGAVTTLGAHK